VRKEGNAEGREFGEVESILVVFGIIAHVGRPWCSSLGSSGGWVDDDFTW